MDERISIVVPVYNVRAYISQCLDSIINQTYQNLEIILVDDGSTDGSEEICDQYACKDARIKVIHKKNEGLVRARKTGVRAATCKYVGYVDADDWIEPEMYQRLYESICISGTDVVAAGRIEEYPDEAFVCKNKLEPGLYSGQKLEEMYSKMIFTGKFYEFGLYPTVWDKLFKRELLYENQLQVPDEIVIGEDVACVYPCMLDAKGIYVMDSCFYHYRKREGSMIKTKDSRFNERLCILILYLIDRCKQTDYWDILKPQIDYYMVHMVIGGAAKHNLKIGQSSPQILFPFQKVVQGSRIILYGAGKIGQKYYHQIEGSGFCNIIGWVDKNAEKYKDSKYKISLPAEVIKYVYDKIVICVASEAVAHEIMMELNNIGVEQAKIVWAKPVYYGLDSIE